MTRQTSTVAGALTALALGLIAASATAAEPDTWASPALAAAHTAYLDGDLDRTVQAARAVLEDPATPEVGRANVLALIDAAWAAGRGKLPADWTVPAAILHLRVASIRKQEPESVSYRLEIGGTTADPAALGQVRITHGSGRVVLDRHEGRGTWSVTPEPDGTFFFELEGPETGSPTPAGLYLLDMEVAGEDTRGWFILTSHVASEAPPVRAPSEGQTFTTGRPTLRFDDFRSPEFRSHERRSLGIYAVRLQPGGPDGRDYHVVWHRWIGSPALTELTLGVDGDMPDTVLEDGDYWLALSFGERRRFGPLKVVRTSRTARPFQVRASDGR